MDSTPNTEKRIVATLQVEYRVKGYKMADALRPDPKWGRRLFVVDTKDLGTDNPAEIKSAAIASAPDGYVFHSVKPLH